MSYKLTKVNYINKQTESLDLHFKPRDFCCVGNEIYFVYENGIGMISDGEINLEWHDNLGFIKETDLTTLSSITFNKSNNSLFIVSENGSQIVQINLDMLNYEEVISKDSANELKKKYLSTSKSETHISSLGFTVVWSVTNCHRCFILKEDDAMPLIGCGKSGFSMSKPETSKIRYPKGIAIMDGAICFADSGNKMLRGVRDGGTFSVVDDCDSLKDVIFNNNKLFFINDDAVHMISSEGDASHLFEVYNSENTIYSFDLLDKDTIYVLEENYAPT